MKMITKTKPSSSERKAHPTSVCDSINLSEASLQVCRICLCSDIEMIEDMDDTLAVLYDELICYDTYENTFLSYCVLCEHQLKRFYNFRQRCRRAHILLKMWSSNRLQPTRALKELYSIVPHTSIGVCTAESKQVIYDYVRPELNTPAHDWPDLELHSDETDDEFHLTEISPEKSALKTEDDMTCTDLKSNVQDFLSLEGDIVKMEKAKQESSDKSILNKPIDGQDTNEPTGAINNNTIKQDKNNLTKDKKRIIFTKEMIMNQLQHGNIIKFKKVTQGADSKNFLNTVINGQGTSNLTHVRNNNWTTQDDIRVEGGIKFFKEMIVDLLENGKFQDIEDHGVRMTKEVFLKAMEQGHLERIGLNGVLSKCPDMDKVRIFLRRLLRRFNPEYETMFRMESLDTPEKKQAEFEARPHTDEYKAAVYKCDICYRVFEVQGKLDYHMKWHDPKNHSVCSICSMRFSTHQQQLTHIQRSHSIAYHCKLCPYRTYSTNGMLSHFGNHKGLRYPCPTCCKVFAQKKNCNTHWQETHCVSTICQICGCGFGNKNRQQTHMQKHSDVRPETLAQPPSVHCNSCDAVFYSHKALDFHRMRSHQPIITEALKLRYQCFYCKVCFVSVEALYEHKRSADHRSDTNITPRPPSHLTCQICREEVKIETNRTMYCHYTKMHPGVPYMSVGWGKQTVLCEQCGKACKDRYEYKEHVRVQHSGERPYVCCECGARFALRQQVRTHLKKHKPAHLSAVSNTKVKSKPRVDKAARRFQCDTCMKIFNYKRSLIRHFRTHTGEKPYPCPLCGKRFTQRRSVKLHIDAVHLGKPAPPRRPRNRPCRQRHRQTHTAPSQRM